MSERIEATESHSNQRFLDSGLPHKRMLFEELGLFLPL